MNDDGLRSLFAPVTPRRAVLLAVFLGLLWLLRHLLVLLLFFVAIERSVGLAAGALSARLGWRRGFAVFVVLLVAGGTVVAAASFGVGEGAALLGARESVVERIGALRETPLFRKLEERAGGGERLVETARHYAAGTLAYVAAAGRLVIHGLLGLVLALVYLSERDELEAAVARLRPDSLVGTLLRWLEYVADAAWVTVQFQVVVSACNAVLTYPVLLLVGIPHATGFLFMVFFSGMVPVVGNFVAGAVLTLLAYQASGWGGVATFTILTFVLHKVESYYLNPRLAARHVRLPGFVLVVSLIVWEHLAGFVGLFLSFPALYVAMRIKDEFQEGAAAVTARAG